MEPTKPFTTPIGPDELWIRRGAQLLAGLVFCGWGIALMVQANMGLGPWDVLHQGGSNHLGLPIGTVNIGVGFLVLMAWLPFRERPGIGTVANVILIGVVADITLMVLPEPTEMSVRLAFLVVGVFLFGPGSGLYIGAGLGPGPRDGLMTALAKRGMSIRMVRTLIELTALAIGIALGGTVGIGTILIALTIGPNVQFFLERLSLPPSNSRQTEVL